MITIPRRSAGSFRRCWAAGAAVAAMVAAAGLTACGNTPLGAAAGPTSKSIGFSESFLTDPFQVVMVRQIEEDAKTRGVDLLPATNANGDTAKQNTDIRTLLSRGVGGLMVVPIDANAIVPAIKAANDRHVPVVSVAEVPQGGKVYVTVNGDNVAMGASACQTIGQRLNGKGAVLELYGTLSSSNGRDRHQGFLDCMKSRYPGIEVVSKPTEWEAAEATDAAQTVLSTRKIDGIYTASDSVMGPGVTKVLQDQGKLKPVGEPGHVVTVSVDGTPFALRQVRDGYQDAVVSQPLDLFAKYGVSYVADALAGKPVLPGPTDHGSKVVESNGNLVDLLPSPVVTKANVEDQTLWGNQS